MTSVPNPSLRHHHHKTDYYVTIFYCEKHGPDNSDHYLPDGYDPPCDNLDCKEGTDNG